MEISKIPCPKCLSNSAFIDGMFYHEHTSCFTCEDSQTITEEHDNLFKLSFSENIEKYGYFMQLNKVLNHLETISVKLKRENDKFEISQLALNGPNAGTILNELSSVDKLINFLIEH